MSFYIFFISSFFQKYFSALIKKNYKLVIFMVAHDVTSWNDSSGGIFYVKIITTSMLWWFLSMFSYFQQKFFDFGEFSETSEALFEKKYISFNIIDIHYVIRWIRLLMSWIFHKNWDLKKVIHFHSRVRWFYGKKLKFQLNFLVAVPVTPE